MIVEAVSSDALKLSRIDTLVEESRTEFLRTDIYPLSWGDGYWTAFADAIRGWHSGVMWLAGQANHGKSAAVITMALNLLRFNDDVRIIDFTLDDDRFTRISRYVANLADVDQNTVREEGFQHSTNMIGDPILERIQSGYDNLLGFGERLVIYDPVTITATIQKLADQKLVDRHAVRALNEELVIATINDIEQIVKYEVSQYPNYRTIVLIDSFYDLTIRHNTQDEIGRHERLGQAIAALSRRYNLRIITTGHVNKHVNMRKPSMDFLKGHGYLRYSAKIILFLYTPQVDDYSDDVLVYKDPRTNRIYPVTCLFLSKNKAGSHHGVFFLYMDMPCSKVDMLDEPSQSSFKRALFES